jgi:DnaJ-class molecular chaperone
MKKSPADYYQLLQVEKTATQDEIKKAYREMALQYHPDINPDIEDEETIKQINEAYSVLSDTAKRKQYDLYGTVGRIAGSGFSGNFTGGMQFRPGWGSGCGCGRKGMGHWSAIFQKARRPEPVVREGEKFICRVALTADEKERGAERSIFVNDAAGRKIFTVTIPAGVMPGQRIPVVEKGPDSPVTVCIEVR